MNGQFILLPQVRGIKESQHQKFFFGGGCRQSAEVRMDSRKWRWRCNFPLVPLLKKIFQDSTIRPRQLLKPLHSPGMCFSLCFLRFSRGCLSRPAAPVVLRVKPVGCRSISHSWKWRSAGEEVVYVWSSRRGADGEVGLQRTVIFTID